MFIFPIMANINAETGFNIALSRTFFNQESIQAKQGERVLNVKVDIPCSGHAPLITSEFNKINGIKNVGFRLPNLFDLIYDPQETNQEEMLSSEIFDIYPATIINKFY